MKKITSEQQEVQIGSLICSACLNGSNLHAKDLLEGKEGIVATKLVVLLETEMVVRGDHDVEEVIRIYGLLLLFDLTHSV